MNSFFSKESYHEFFKQVRKSLDLTMEEVANKMNLSIGSISNIENNKKSDYSSSRAQALLKCYGYNEEYLSNLLLGVKEKFDIFIHNVIYVERETKLNYESFLDSMQAYQNTPFYILANVATLIFSIYNDDLGHITKLEIENIEMNIIYLDKEYLLLANLYLAQYFTKIRKMEKAESYYSIISNSIITIDSDLSDMVNYCLARFYIAKNNVFKSNKYCVEAVNGFAKRGNYARLINTNIIIANQLLISGEYSKSIDANKDTLDKIYDNTLFYEKNTLRYNIAFAYSLLGDFISAIIYFNQIDKDAMSEMYNCFFAIALSESELKEDAKLICMQYLSNCNNLFYKQLYQAIYKYCIDSDYSKLTKKLSKIYYSSELNNVERDFMLSILTNHYKQLNQYKKAFKCLEERFAINFN